MFADGQRPLVFVASDTGFAPVKSLIEHALSLDASPSLSLFWLATRPDGHFMANQCRAWSEALDLFEYAVFGDADPVAGAHQVTQAIRADLFDIDCDFYIAGSRPSSARCRRTCRRPACRRRSAFGEGRAVSSDACARGRRQTPAAAPRRLRCASSARAWRPSSPTARS